MPDKINDTVIIGGGPAGYTAAMYCSRAGLSNIVLEKFSAGGQMCQTSQIDNYPGFDEGTDGFTLGFKMQSGAEKFGTTTIQTEVLSVDFSEKIKKIETDVGTYLAKTIIIATGAEHKHLGISSEETLLGKGLGYCAACDGMLYKNKTVAVIGGGNSAAADTILLSKICKKVYLIHRRDTLRATKIYHEPLMKTENVEFIWNTTVSDFIAEDVLRGVKIKNVQTGTESTIKCDGVFISIGRAPATDLFRNQINLDSSGYIISGEDTKTNIPGVFAAGDVRTKTVRQIVTAVSDGAIASHYAEEYIAQTSF